MDSQKVFEWTDAHFCSLSSQTNIYGLQKLRKENNTCKLLVSSLESSFLSVEYQQVKDKVTPLTKGIQFSHMPVPGDAEIVSIDAFERLAPKKGLVVGVTYVMVVKKEAGSDERWKLSPVKENLRDRSRGPHYFKLKGNMLQDQESKPKNQVLNIYAAELTEDELTENSGKENKLEIVADSCQSTFLTYIPFVLTHTDIVTDDGKTEQVFLLSGSDFNIHVYQELPASQLGVTEVPTLKFFPELEDLACNVLQVEISKPNPNHRLTALGFEDGTIRVHLVDIKKREMLQDWSTLMDSPVTSLHFFTQQKFVPLPPCLERENLPDDVSPSWLTEDTEDPSLAPINLLMTTALEPAMVYRDVLKSGLSESLVLPESHKYDSALCSLAADIDFDGQHELLVGTYGQELLVYKFYPTMEKWVPLSPPPPPSGIPKAARPFDVAGAPPSGDQWDEAGKQRHKSDEGNAAAADKGAPESEQQLQQRKVKSQENLLWLASVKPCSEKGLPPGYVPERKDADPLELRQVPEPHYKLLWQRSFPCPVMGLDCAEMMGDGIENLVVLTTHGLHIMQPDMNEVAKLIESRMMQMVASGSDVGDEFRKLQVE